MDFRILVFSRDAQLFLLLQHILAIEGFSALLTDRVDDALAGIRHRDVRALIVDCSTNGMDIYSLRAFKRIRHELGIALLFNRPVEATNRQIDEADVDLILARPFNPVRLVDFLRRLRNGVLTDEGHSKRSRTTLRFADLELDLAAVRATRKGHYVPLTALQFRLLRHLMENPAVVLGREELIAAGWKENTEVEPRTVDIHMGHIRRALKMFGPDLIRTVRTRGYALDAETFPDTD